MFITGIKLLLSILIFVSLPFTILALSPIYLIRYIVAKTARFVKPELGKILTTKSTCVGVDNMTKEPQWTLLLVFAIKGRPRFEGFKKRFIEKIIEAKNAAGELTKPELQQYVTKHLGFLFWKWDKDFNIDNHLHQNPGEVKYKVLDEDALFNIGQTLIYKPYAEHRSPWELIFLDGYQMEGETEPCSVIMLRAHHALADGFSLLKLFVLDFCQAEGLNVAQHKHVPGTPAPEEKTISFIQKYLGPIYMLLRGPYDLASAMIDVLLYNSNEWHVPEKHLTRTMNSAYTSGIPIKAIKDVKQLYNSSFASVLLTAYTGALRKFMSEAGYKVPSNILCAIALPVPNHPRSKLRNHATGVLVRLPTGLDCPVKRLRAVDANQLELRTSTLPATIFLSMLFVGGLFAWMTKMLTKNQVTTAVGSIFPGPEVAMSGAGFTALEVSYAGGLTRGNTGLGFSSLSYNGKMVIIAGIDEGIVPSSKLPCTKLLEYMVDELAHLKKDAESKSYDAQNV